MSGSRITKTCIRGVHVIVAVVSLHHRWVVDIAQVPVLTHVPDGHTAIVIIVGRSLPSIQLGRAVRRLRREAYFARIHYVVVGLCIATNIVGGVSCQRGESHRHVRSSRDDLQTFDGRVSRGSVDETSGNDMSTCCRTCNIGRIRSNSRHGGRRHDQWIIYLVNAVCAGSHQQSHAYKA